jgi:glycosyltransferase involved in cell wall biosynthesis
MPANTDPRVLVVNFNAPELNQLAMALAETGQLTCLVRPYANLSRWWERAMASIPGVGRAYAGSFGRRRLDNPALRALAREAGVPADMAAAMVGRLTALPDGLRHRWANELRKQVRRAVAGEGARCAAGAQADCVVAYEGFALPAFEAARRAGRGRLYLNYPVAHHRQRRKIRDEENRREPLFASTWPGFDDWTPDHEARLDREIELADHVLLGSAYAADSFAAEGVPRAKLMVVPYGVDLDTFKPGLLPPPVRPFRVIYAGQLTQRKGLSYLLRGYSLFRRQDTELTLVGGIVGSREPLLPYAGMFTHVPHQTRPALAERYRQAHVFVLPTLVEGMPLVVLEAMACGLPVIVTANGPAGIVRDGIDGYIIPERDDEAVADRLERLYRDPELRQRMGHQAGLRAREFSWQAYATGVRQCLGSRGPQ